MLIVFFLLTSFVLFVELLPSLIKENINMLYSKEKLNLCS